MAFFLNIETVNDIDKPVKEIETARPVKFDERRTSHASHNVMLPGILPKSIWSCDCIIA